MLKKAIPVILFFLMGACSGGFESPRENRFPAGTGRIVIELQGIRNDQGDIFVSLFSGRRGFPGDFMAAIENRHAKIKGRACMVTIENLPYGDYAIAVLHDENNDGKMNANFLGVPKEGFGFSGNPGTRLGPPDYEDARFLLLAPDKRLQIVMQYETVGRERRRIMQEKRSQ